MPLTAQITSLQGSYCTPPPGRAHNTSSPSRRAGLRRARRTTREIVEVATLGLTSFRSAVRRSTVIDTLVSALKEARSHIEQSIETMRAPRWRPRPAGLLGGVRAHERIIEQWQGLWTDGQLVESYIDASCATSAVVQGFGCRPCKKSQVHGPGVRKPPKNEPAGDGARRGHAPGYGDLANAEGACGGA